MTIEYWADYICPWCYLALDRVAYLTQAHGATVRWRPYELHPEVPPEGAPIPELGKSRDSRRWLRDELAAAQLPTQPRRRWSNSRKALGLSVWAEPLPQWPELHRALYRAYFAEGRDIGDTGALLLVAESVGISADAAAEVIGDGAGLTMVDASKERALDLGIGATPGWLLSDGATFTGVHARTVFDKVMARQGRPD